MTFLREHLDRSDTYRMPRAVKSEIVPQAAGIERTSTTLSAPSIQQQWSPGRSESNGVKTQHRVMLSRISNFVVNPPKLPSFHGNLRSHSGRNPGDDDNERSVQHDDEDEFTVVGSAFPMAEQEAKSKEQALFLNTQLVRKYAFEEERTGLVATRERQIAPVTVREPYIFPFVCRRWPGHRSQ